MKILAFDCSGAGICAAVTDDEKLLGEAVLQSEVKHSVTLLPAIETLMSSCGVSMADIDVFAVTAGPGSFTGVRIGVSLLKGLAFGSNKPCISVSSLEALAYNLRGLDGVYVPVMDARRGQFYNALFDGEKRLCEDRLITAEKLTEELEELGRIAYLCGDGSDIAQKLVTYGNLKKAPERLTCMSGYSVAMCALNNYKNGVGMYTDTNIKPLYLRKSQAEREREERIKNNDNR